MATSSRLHRWEGDTLHVGDSGVIHVGGALTLATRIRHQVNMHASFDRDETQIAAHYAVKGTDRVLVMATWITHEMAEDAAVVDAMLEWMDMQAQEGALLPDDGKPHGAWM